MNKITEITSREFGAYIKGGGDLVFIPAASPERLGPHLPVGARGMIAEIIADKFAEYYNGVSLPLIPYTTLYDDFEGRGSIDMDTALMNRYFTDVCDELTANKMRRIIFISFHQEFYYLCNEYFQDKNIAVAWLSPDKFPHTGLDRHGYELWRFIACLRLAGNKAMIAKVFEKTRKYFGLQPPENKRRDILAMFGNTGYKIQGNEWRFYPVNFGKNLPGEGEFFTMPKDDMLDYAAHKLESWIKSFGEPLAALTEYQEYLDANPFVREF